MGSTIRRRDVLAVAWLGALIAVVAQGALQRWMAGAAPDARWLLEWRVVPILIWAAASPWILDLGARLPARGPAALRHLALHVGVAAAWIYASNVLMRLPGIAAGNSWAALPAEALEGAIRFGPGATALYAALALLGAVIGTGHGARDAGRTAETGARMAGRLALREGLRIHLVPRGDVRWVEADADHVRVHTAKRAFRVRATMRGFEEELAQDGFLRVHRSALVHPRALREIQPFFHGDYVAILDDGTELRIPRTRRQAIEALLSLAPGDAR